MQSRAHYQLEHGGDERILIVLRGELLGTSLVGLDGQVQRQLAQLPSSKEVLVDLTDVDLCDRRACRTLARVQRMLRAHGCRTAWLADRPRIRGAAWWIVHASGDPQAMPVTHASVAEDWFSHDGERLDQLDAQTSCALDRVVEAFANLRGLKGLKGLKDGRG